MLDLLHAGRSGAKALGHFQMGDVKENIPRKALVYLQLPGLITFLRGEELQQPPEKGKKKTCTNTALR